MHLANFCTWNIICSCTWTNVIWQICTDSRPVISSSFDRRRGRGDHKLIKIRFLWQWDRVEYLWCKSSWPTNHFSSTGGYKCPSNNIEETDKNMINYILKMFGVHPCRRWYRLLRSKSPQPASLFKVEVALVKQCQKKRAGPARLAHQSDGRDQILETFVPHLTLKYCYFMWWTTFLIAN